MLRLRPTTITITSRELSDSERRCRYRKHLRESHRCGRRLGRTSSLDQDDALQNDALQNDAPGRHPSPTPGSANGNQANQATASPSQDPAQGDREGRPPEPLPEHNGDSASISPENREAESRVFDSSLNSPPRRAEQWTIAFRPRHDIETQAVSGSSHEHQDDSGGSSAGHGLAFHNTTLPAASPEPETSVNDGQSTGNHVQGPERPATTPEDSEAVAEAPTEVDVRPTGRNLPVYNDHLSVREQPQTPRQLPEARHQSRFDGSYTASVGGRHQRVETEATPATGRRARTRPNGSPVGLRILGFQGLYGGSENADEA
ncbi:hypothetical protein ACJZ2D_003511 [Fusarium nematophilum]